MKHILVGMRKFIMAATFLGVAVILLLTGFVPADTWMQYMSDVMVAFFATNVGEHIINVGKEWIKERGKKDIKELMNEYAK